jgi:hypothetical protein
MNILPCLCGSTAVICLIQHLHQFTDFDETWYDSHALRIHAYIISVNAAINTNITRQRELLKWKRH